MRKLATGSGVLTLFLAVIVVFVLMSEQSKAEERKLREEDYTILMIGIDEEGEEVGRADSILLLHVAPIDQAVYLISIPRDSYVKIPCGSNGAMMDKINHAYAYGEINWKMQGGGAACVTQVVETLFDLPPIAYVSYHTENIVSMIDQGKGVIVTPQFSFCQSVSDGTHCFKKGKQVTMMGTDVLAFVRHRSTLPRGDLDRCANQRQVVTNLFIQFQDRSKLDQLRIIAYAFTQVKTDVSIVKITRLATTNFEEFKFHSILLQGSARYGTVYYYDINRKHLDKIKEIL